MSGQRGGTPGTGAAVGGSRGGVPRSTPRARPPLSQPAARTGAKPAAKQTTAKQPAAKQPAAKQAAARQPAARQQAPRKQPAARQPVQKAAPGKAVPNRAAPGRAVPKKAVAKKAVPRKAVGAKPAPVARNRPLVTRELAGGTATLRRAPEPQRRQPPRRPVSRRPARRPPRPADPVRRLRAALIVLVFVLTIFAGRLVQMQGLDGPGVAAKALLERSATKSLPAHRGDIVDRNGVPLAQTRDRRNVLVDQTLVPHYMRLGPDGRRVVVGVNGAAQDLAPILGLPVATVAAKLTGTSRGAYLVRDITPETAREVIRLPIPGVDLEQASRRVYPADNTAANVLGFVSATTGQAFGGIEEAKDRELAGRPGWLRYEHGADGTRIPTGTTDLNEPQPGHTVKLTLNRDLQWRAQQLLAAQVAATGAQSGSVVVLDARTAQVLALATAPTFDPNDPGRASQADMRNRPLQDVFEPGSTAKVITLSAALEEHSSTPLTRVTVPPQLRRSDRTFNDAEVHGTERLTVAGVLAQSSNIGTILTGEKLSKQKLYEYQQRFGVGTRTGIGLAESAGELAPPQNWSGSQWYTLMFGQGMSVNALQAASVFATLANDGVRVAPRLVAGETDADGQFRPAPAAPSTRVVSAETARQMRLMMESVVGSNGTAELAEVPGYRVAGKTGTAQAYDPGCNCYRGYTASFIGMAPADDPALVVAVVIQQPVRGHFGGTVAAPVFQQLMTYALAENRVPPTGAKAPEIPLNWR